MTVPLAHPCQPCPTCGDCACDTEFGGECRPCQDLRYHRDILASELARIRNELADTRLLYAIGSARVHHRDCSTLQLPARIAEWETALGRAANLKPGARFLREPTLLPVLISRRCAEDVHRRRCAVCCPDLPEWTPTPPRRNPPLGVEAHLPKHVIRAARTLNAELNRLSHEVLVEIRAALATSTTGDELVKRMLDHAIQAHLGDEPSSALRNSKG